MSRSRTYRPRVECLESRLVPATFTVKNLLDDGSAGTLRAAIGLANGNGSTTADTIVFKPGLEGTIVLNGTEIDITGSLTLTGPGASKIAVSGNFASRIFKIFSSADLSVKLSGLELRHGKVLGTEDGGAIYSDFDLKLNKMRFTLNQSADDGGAIHSYGNLTVTKSTISGNSANYGGGINCAAAEITNSTISGNSAKYGGGINCGTATITSSTITANTAGTYGGGILCGDTATITSSTIAGNTSGGTGGGIDSDTAMITASTVSGNSAGTDGGGIWCGTATITGSTIAGNRAVGLGGGIFCINSATITASTIAGNTATSSGGGLRIGAGNSLIDRCTISGNTSLEQRGGGIRSGGTLTLLNSTLSGNQAATEGGGILSSGGLTARNCTIAFNQAGGVGGGMAIDQSDALLLSCLIGDNAAGTTGKNLASLNVGDVFTLDHCLVSVFADTDAMLEGFEGSTVNTSTPGTNLINFDARLAPLARNGGKTQTHALKKGSPAINAGSNLSALPFDQRGKPFKRRFGPAVDIGAFERQ